MNNAFLMRKHETTAFSGDQNPEESSWTMYFEASPPSIFDVGDCSSSSVSDAMSFVATKKTVHLSNSNKFIDIIKWTINREISFVRHHHYDLEDTASSPSRSPIAYSVIDLFHNNTRHGDETTNENGENAVQNQGELSIDLKERGLCLVPLSLVTNFLG